MRNTLEHPDITSALRTGYPCGTDTDEPICPICGSACEYVFKTKFHEIIGCDECLTAYDAIDEEECFRG